MYYLMVKKSPQQEGYGILGRFDGRDALANANQAAFEWAHRVSMDWQFRIVDISDYSYPYGKFGFNTYYNDNPQPNLNRR